MNRSPRLAAFALAALVAFATSGCAGSVKSWIVAQRDHQGDVAVAHQNVTDAAAAYELALRVDPADAHAKAGLVAAQTKLATLLFSASKFDDAIGALMIAAKYAPDDDRISALRGEIEQAEIKRDIVVSNYPAYKETGAAIQRSVNNLKTMSATVATTLKRFDYTYDSNDLTQAIRDSYELDFEVRRITNRLIQYRELVDSGIPDHGDASAAPPSSLLPLP